LRDYAFRNRTVVVPQKRKARQTHPLAAPPSLFFSFAEHSAEPRNLRILVGNYALPLFVSPFFSDTLGVSQRRGFIVTGISPQTLQLTKFGRSRYLAVCLYCLRHDGASSASSCFKSSSVLARNSESISSKIQSRKQPFI
jgi:hypothetical protein